MNSHDLRIFFLLQHAAHRLKKEADRRLTKSGGLTTAQAAVLVIVSGAGSISQKEIADQLQLRESAMTAMIARLQKAELISRTQDPADARAKCIELTKKGEKTLKAASRTFSEINEVLDNVLGKPGTTAFARDLNSIMDAFRADEPTGG